MLLGSSLKNCLLVFMACLLSALTVIVPLSRGVVIEVPLSKEILDTYGYEYPVVGKVYSKSQLEEMKAKSIELDRIKQKIVREENLFYKTARSKALLFSWLPWFALGLLYREKKSAIAVSMFLLMPAVLSILTVFLWTEFLAFSVSLYAGYFIGNIKTRIIGARVK